MSYSKDSGLNNMLQMIDIFGEPIKILINKKKTVTTSLGGIFTILSIMLILVFTWFTGKDILLKEKPFSYTQKDVLKAFPLFYINKQEFPFAFSLTDDDNIPIYAPEYVEIYLLHYFYEFNETTQAMYLDHIDEIPFRNCENFDFPFLTQEDFNQAQLGYSLCSFNTNYNFSVYGYWTESRVSHVSVAVKKCGGEISGLKSFSNDSLKRHLLTFNKNYNYTYNKTLLQPLQTQEENYKNDRELLKENLRLVSQKNKDYDYLKFRNLENKKGNIYYFSNARIHFIILFFYNAFYFFIFI